MDWQTTIAGVFMFAAALYVASIGWRKLRSFSGTSSCEGDCGCDSDVSTTRDSVQIHKN